ENLNVGSNQEEVESMIQQTIETPTPRGIIYDRNHQAVVDYEPLYSITYTPPKGVQLEDKYEVAKELVKYMSVDKEDIEKITPKNKKEYWYIKSEANQKKALSRLTKEEKEELDDVEQYREMLDRIDEDEIGELTEEELKIIAVMRELDKAYELTPQIVKNKDVSSEEYARIA